MPYTSTEQRKRVFRHWQTWVGLLVCGFCGGAGSFIGSNYFGHSSIGAGIGGGIGGLLFARVVKYVDRRYYH